MSVEIACFRCGVSLASLSLPLTRQDQCPSCSVYLHVCMMCGYFAKNVAKQCREDDAEEVHEKERANFCEWFTPGADAFDGERAAADEKSRDALASLFADEGGESADDSRAQSAAEDLFK
jgi:hypothetical protein